MDLIKKFDIHGMAHITGGGLTENIPRSIPENLSASIDTNSWAMPEIFKWLQTNGSLEDEDMFRIFNCGIGMILIVKKEDSERVLEEIKNHDFNSFNIGKIINKESNNSVVFK